MSKKRRTSSRPAGPASEAPVADDEVSEVELPEDAPADTDADPSDDDGAADEPAGPADDGAETSGAETVPEEHRDEDGLVSRLAVIGAQPLAERADALSQLHDELRTRLESGDAPRASA